MKAVVLAGGKGTRLAPYSKILPKPLMPIGDMPILEIILRQLRNAGVAEAILTVGHMAQLLRAFFQNGEALGLTVSYSYEDEPLGTAGPLALIDGLNSTFLVTNGDVLTTLQHRDLLAKHHVSGAMMTIAMYHRKIKVDLDVIESNDDIQVTRYIEKPTYDFEVSMGIYVFEPAVMEYIPAGKYLDFPDLVLKLLDAGQLVQGFSFDGYWKDLGRPDDYEAAVDEFSIYKSQILGEVE